MAKLTYFYSVMNAGKSLNLLQANHNYKTKNLKTLLIKPTLENRFGEDRIGSRLGISESATSITEKDNIFNIVKTYDDLTAVLVDEGQFLSKEQVIQLSDIVDILNIDVLVYGLKTNIQGTLFKGSAALLVYADKILEIKQLCSLCLKKATMHVKFNSKGQAIFDEEIDIGAEEKYLSVCREHYKEYRR